MYVYFQFVAVILFVGHLEWCKDFGCPVLRSFCGSCPRLEVLLEVLFFDIIINSQGLVSKFVFFLWRVQNSSIGYVLFLYFHGYCISDIFIRTIAFQFIILFLLYKSSFSFFDRDTHSVMHASVHSQWQKPNPCLLVLQTDIGERASKFICILEDEGALEYA